MDLGTAAEILEKFGLSGLVVALLFLVVIWLVRVLLDEDRSAVLRGQCYRLAYRLNGRIDQEKKYISNDLKGRLNLARRKCCYSQSGPPTLVDVVWIEGGSGSSHDVNEGEFVVRLDPGSQQEKNIAVLAGAVVKRTTLVGIRHSVEQPLQLAVDLTLTRKLLAQVGNKAALDWFLQHEYLPTVEADAATRRRLNQVVEIDDRGLFTLILLVELDNFARRIYGRPPRPYMAGEIEGLVDYLFGLVRRQDVPMEYFRAFIRICVIRVAKTRKILRTIAPYVKAMQIGLGKEVYSVYVIAFDKAWLGEMGKIEALREYQKRVEHLDKELQTGTEATKDFDVTYSYLDETGRRRSARCMRFAAPERS